LPGYRALIDYWQRTAGWTQQWTTLRNLADRFEQLGDDSSRVLSAVATATVACWVSVAASVADPW
jgi:hypothetical protein